MNRYRIKEIARNKFIIQKRCCFWWVEQKIWDPLDGNQAPLPTLHTLEDARNRVREWQELDAFVPVIHAP